jgi:hypothetical protein
MIWTPSRLDDGAVRLGQALTGLAEGLGLMTVDEGVETEEQASLLLAQGWQMGQGWLFGKAAPVDSPLGDRTTQGGRTGWGEPHVMPSGGCRTTVGEGEFTPRTRQQGEPGPQGGFEDDRRDH